MEAEREWGEGWRRGRQNEKSCWSFQHLQHKGGVQSFGVWRNGSARGDGVAGRYADGARVVDVDGRWQGAEGWLRGEGGGRRKEMEGGESVWGGAKATGQGGPRGVEGATGLGR